MVLVGWYIRGYTQKYSDALAGVVDQDRKCCLVGHYLFICWSHDALQLSRDFSTLVMSCTQDQKKKISAQIPQGFCWGARSHPILALDKPRSPMHEQLLMRTTGISPLGSPQKMLLQGKHWTPLHAQVIFTQCMIQIIKDSDLSIHMSMYCRWSVYTSSNGCIMEPGMFSVTLIILLTISLIQLSVHCV